MRRKGASVARYKNVRWDLPGEETDAVISNEAVNQALLMDIRDELQKLNRLLHCPKFTDIPHPLRAIRSNTAKPKKGKKR